MSDGQVCIQYELCNFLATIILNHKVMDMGESQCYTSAMQKWTMGHWLALKEILCSENLTERSLAP